MPDVFVEFDAVALDLPGAAALCGKIVLVGILAFLKTARKRPRFLMGGLCCFLCRSPSGRARKHEQCDNPPSTILIFIIGPPRVELAHKSR